MVCECKHLERALLAMRESASQIERDCVSGPLQSSIRVRLARAHALSACDELVDELEHLCCKGRCEAMAGERAQRSSGNVEIAPERRTNAESLAEP